MKDADFFILLLMAALLLVVLLFFLTLRKIKNQYEHRCETLDDVLNGNLNARILRKPNEYGRKFDFSINSVIEDFQNKKRMYERSELARKRQLSSIAHDLRTPLTSVIGYLEAVINGIADDEGQKEDYIKIAYEKSVEIKRFTDELFEMAKIDGEELILKPEKLDVNEITRSTLIQFIPLLKKDCLELAVEIPETRFMVLFDKYSLERIIQNVFQNALQHGKSGGILGVSVLEKPAEYSIKIWDKGKGIPEDKIEFIFDRLFKVDDSRKSEYTGYGLGLAIAKKLCEINNSRITVSSNETTGTEFEITIPKIRV